MDGTLFVPSPWLNVEQAASYLHMRESRLTALVKSGEIESHRHSRAALVHTSDLDAWMRRQPSAAAPVAMAAR